MMRFDLATTPLRELNRTLHAIPPGTNDAVVEVVNPRGAHAIAVGINAPVEVTVRGPTGYYCGGKNKLGRITVEGNAGPGVAENMMSGEVRVRGSASQYAGASGRGGLLVIEGDAASRCGISMKGIEIVVGGNVGHMSAFMGQAGTLVVCGNAGEALGDSLYEARLFVAGTVAGLGADCVEKEMRGHHVEALAALLERAKINADAARFRRYGSARTLYNFHPDNAVAEGADR